MTRGNLPTLLAITVSQRNAMKPTPRYRIHAYHPGHFHVLAPDGLPIYDDSPNGDDQPIIFHDEDRAIACADRCNTELLQSQATEEP